MNVLHCCVILGIFTVVLLQAFWIRVEDVDSEIILHHEYFLLKSYAFFTLLQSLCSVLTNDKKTYITVVRNVSAYIVISNKKEVNMRVYP